MKSSKNMDTLKRISYSIATIFILLVSIHFQASAIVNDKDSTVINIDKRNQTLVNQATNANKTLRENLQELFLKSGMTLDDDTWRGIRRIVNSDLNKDTLVVITQNDKSIKVVINTNTKKNNESVNSDEKPRDTGNSSNNDKQVKVGLGGVVVKDGKDEVRVGWNGVYVNDGGRETNITLRDSARANRRESGFNSRSGFNIYFGLNSFTNTGSIGGAYNSKDFELSPFGSRYFGFGWTRSGTISRGKKAALKVSYGLEFSWYNFMLENNAFFVKNTDNIGFADYRDAKGNQVALCRNKLTVANINIPVMPYIAFKKGSTVTYIAAGGYVGYRLDSYTKTKEEDSGRKEWNHSSFFLNNVRYGLAFELGLNNFPDLFVNYDLNNMFQDGRGPKIGGISFGIRL
ncbi:MAG: PorT family protein [Arcicella sp.]|jgi:hypothetical protein|nr:PorT family protein [Arcicella sp.]